MLNIDNIELKKLLMLARYDDLMGFDHELYTIKEDCIEFSIDAPTDFGKGDVFTLVVTDEEVNNATGGIVLLQYYDERISEFRTELEHKYYSKIEKKIVKAIDTAFTKFVNSMQYKLSLSTADITCRNYSLYIDLKLTHGLHKRHANLELSLSDTVTLSSFKAQLKEQLDELKVRTDKWIASLKEEK